MSGGQNGNGENRGRNGHVLVWEQPGLDDSERQPKKHRAWMGARHVVAFMLFLGMANAYIMRTNMSVAIVVMVNQTWVRMNNPNDSKGDSSPEDDGHYEWDKDEQGYILSSFFWGYVITQIPFGILAKRYGSKYFLGIGMLINSVFGLIVPRSAEWGYGWLILVRFIQGLGEGPIVPCTHAMLAKWIPPSERSRIGAFVYAGAQFGTVISFPLSGLLAKWELVGKWPSIFYVFGAAGTLWCIAFLIWVSEDPESHPNIAEEEKKYILNSLWGTTGSSSPPVPWMSILTSLPFWAILIAHVAQNYGYETLMTLLPTYMKEILNFKITENGFLSALPYLAMWIFSMFISHVTDWMILTGKFSTTTSRKIINSIGQYGPAIALIVISYTGSIRWLTVTILTVGVGVNGAIYSGFKVNHLDISPRFAGILMSFTNCIANIAGFLAPILGTKITKNTTPTVGWRIVFMISGVMYIVCATFYVIFGSGEPQSWDNPETDAVSQKKRKSVGHIEAAQSINETQY